MSYISQNFRLFHVSNLSVQNFRIFAYVLRQVSVMLTTDLSMTLQGGGTPRGGSEKQRHQPAAESESERRGGHGAHAHQIQVKIDRIRGVHTWQWVVSPGMGIRLVPLKYTEK